MKKLTLYSLYLMVFWFVLFFINRLFFVYYQQPIGNKIKNNADIVKAFYYGFPLDLAVAIIFILLPLLFANLFFVLQNKIYKKVALALVLFFLLLYVGVGLADAGLYKEWNAKINMQALAHFKNPSEVFKTISTKLLLLFVFLLTIIIAPFYYFYKKKIHPTLHFDGITSMKKRVSFGLLFFILSTGLAIIGIRGGIFNIPINQSIAYFSNDPMANDLAVNPFYSIIQDFDIKSKLPDSSVYKITSNELAALNIKPDFTISKDSTIPILNTQRPNIVYIFLEGWSADNISVLGGIEGCTPKFNQWCNEGLLFTQAYADAYVSDQGIVAGLSAYPSAHRMAIANQPTKVHNLPCISDELIPLGYHTSFLFGGELVYGNLRGYLLEKKFKTLKEVYDLTQYPSGKLGVHDEYTFKELLLMLNQQTSPFLQGFFTSSTHMPYDYTPSDDWKSTKSDAEKLYTESMHYADIHLGRFLDAAKKQTWWDSTLIIIVSDHSHNSIKQWDAMSGMRQKIPMLFTGGALKPAWRGKQWTQIVSQLDIVSTLLHQMQLPAKRYPWSRNMLNPYKPSSAFYVFYGGAGYVTDSGYVATSYDNLPFIHSNMTDSVQMKTYQTKALSFQQLVYEDVKNRE